MSLQLNARPGEELAGNFLLDLLCLVEGSVGPYTYDVPSRFVTPHERWKAKRIQLCRNVVRASLGLRRSGDDHVAVGSLERASRKRRLGDGCRWLRRGSRWRENRLTK